MTRLSDEIEPWWDSSPWDFVIAATCLAVQLVVAITFLDLAEWPPRLALAALTAYCFWLLEKAIRKWLADRQPQSHGDIDESGFR